MIILLIYTFVNILLWTTAQGALKVAKDSLQADQRPWVLVTTIYPEFPATGPKYAAGQPIKWTIWYSNYGRSPANNVKSNRKLFVGPKAMQQADWYFLHMPDRLSGGSSETGSVLPPGGPPAPRPLVREGRPIDVGQNYGTIFSESASQEDIDFLIGRDFGMVAVGRIEYWHGSEYHWTDFCHFTFANGAVASCPKYNDAHWQQGQSKD